MFGFSVAPLALVPPPPLTAPPLAPFWLLLPPPVVLAAAATAAAVPATVATVVAAAEPLPTAVTAVSALRAGGVCRSTYSLNITEGRRLAEVGGLRKPEVHGWL